jgi:hypothetical protein
MTVSLIFQKLLSKEGKITDNKVTAFFVKRNNNRSLPNEMEDLTG